jgi:hypothetical protein
LRSKQVTRLAEEITHPQTRMATTTVIDFIALFMVSSAPKIEKSKMNNVKNETIHAFYPLNLKKER